MLISGRIDTHWQIGAESWLKSKRLDLSQHTDGELFSIVLPTLSACRTERDKWLLAKINRKNG
ncbi:MAG: DUF3873 domain-containing protein [Prevotellaceae bacterium]|nr:DUF3873 domain-containing protein [Prevotellaceae bacterium]